MPVVSVIIPVYKVDIFLQRCVNSVLNQTFYDFELLLIVDGDPGMSSAICDTYSQIDNRIRVIHTFNGGQARARNLGLLLFDGQWITFIDSDDYVHSRYIELLYNAVVQGKTECAICGLKRVWENEIPDQVEDCSIRSEVLFDRFSDNKLGLLVY